MKEIIIQKQKNCLQAALVEDGILVEIFEQEGSYSRLIGNIYRGRVENILPGMQAAFVDIGLEKNSFLYVADALPQRYEEDGEKVKPEQTVKIDQVLKPRQELLVQVLKEPVGNKGARVTTNLTLPGRYVVLLPKTDYVGVSRKISDENEKERLRELASNNRPAGMGVIVRTLAEGLGNEEIAEDIAQLVQLWETITKHYPHVSVPGLVHQDADLISRLVRDLIDQEVVKIIVDQEESALTLREALNEIGHPAAKKVFVEIEKNLFNAFTINDELKKSLQPKVWLKSGGYLVIHQTEALTAIDVNTGKYVGKSSLEDTILHTNLEAAEEIARQLRLRNLGGIIIIDFIDMLFEENQQKVLNKLETACLRDKTKTDILGLTRLGLVEMTRKKVGQTLQARYTELCPSCNGTGRNLK